MQNETILMVVALTYLLIIVASYSALRKSRVSRGLLMNLIMGFNVSTILVLVFKGICMAPNGFQPSWFITSLAVVICTILLYGHVKVAGTPFFDSLVVSIALVSTAAVMPVGLYALLQEGIKMSLIWPWIVASFILTIFSMVTLKVKRRKRKKKNEVHA